MSSGTDAPFPIAILISGRGSNMVAIARAVRSGRAPARVAVVLSDKEGAAGLERARELGLTSAAVTPTRYQSRAEYDQQLIEALTPYQPRLVALAGFMRILGPAFVREFAGRLLNIHPSLLPDYPGLHTHRRVLADGRREHGCSVHFVTDELDGGQVILQAKVPVLPGDSEDTLSARVQVQEHRIYPMVIEWYACGRLQWRDSQPWFDGKPLGAPLRLEDLEKQRA
jgi:phosphoribosylglycinamide formyltransferase 1